MRISRLRRHNSVRCSERVLQNAKPDIDEIKLVRTRVFILDFVLANLDNQYLETEAAKVSYFHEKLRLSLAILPCRRYTEFTGISGEVFMEASHLTQAEFDDRLVTRKTLLNVSTT